jgi:hypothetical protein
MRLLAEKLLACPEIGIQSFNYVGGGAANSGSPSTTLTAGEEHTNRWLILTCTVGKGNAMGNATIGGVSATKAASQVGGNAGSAVYFAKVPNGTSVSCSVSASYDGDGQWNMRLYSVILDGGNLVELDSHNAAGTSVTGTLTTFPKASCIIGCACKTYPNGTSWTSTTGATPTEITDANQESTHMHSHAYVPPENIDAASETFTATTAVTAAVSMASFGIG